MRRPSPPPRTGSASRRRWSRSAWTFRRAASPTRSQEARAIADEIGLPAIVRPAFILGGRGTGIATTLDELVRLACRGLEASPIDEILIESSIAGWKEFELEVMRDRADNCVVVCSIENLDPMGIHTGDSITVAPAQTLSDVEYQEMRDAAFACIRRVGVETGGSNVQFAVDPSDGRQVVIEMNPRVSRSSALASKATGFPIAKIAARLAVGYTLDEIPNDITRRTPASFEPSIDYVVTKVPRWAFEKLPGTSGVLGTADAERGRGHGHRPDVPREPAEGTALAGDGPSRPQRRPGGGRLPAVEPTPSCSRRPPSRRPRGSSTWARPCAEASPSMSWPRRPPSIRGSSTRWPWSSRSATYWSATAPRT